MGGAVESVTTTTSGLAGRAAPFWPPPHATRSDPTKSNKPKSKLKTVAKGAKKSPPKNTKEHRLAAERLRTGQTDHTEGD